MLYSLPWASSASRSLYRPGECYHYLVIDLCPFDLIQAMSWYHSRPFVGLHLLPSFQAILIASACFRPFCHSKLTSFCLLHWPLMSVLQYVNSSRKLKIIFVQTFNKLFSVNIRNKFSWLVRPHFKHLLIRDEDEAIC